MKEGPLDIDDQLKFWVKKALELDTGEEKSHETRCCDMAGRSNVGCGRQG